MRGAADLGKNQGIDQQARNQQRGFTHHQEQNSTTQDGGDQQVNQSSPEQIHGDRIGADWA